MISSIAVASALNSSTAGLSSAITIGLLFSSIIISFTSAISFATVATSVASDSSLSLTISAATFAVSV